MTYRQVANKLHLMNLKRDLKAYLRRENITQVQLAERTGIPVSSINRIIKGRRSGLSTKNLQRLWHLLYQKRE